MKPATFAYHQPSSVGEAIALLRADDEAKLIAGGQSLMPLLNMRLAQPTALVDLNAVDGLDGVRMDDGHLVVGALTRQRTLELDPQATANLPVLARVMRHIGHVTIRNRGTVGGSIAHADPSAELPLVVVALDAEVVAEGPGGRRTIAARDFYEGFLTTTLAPDEILVEIRLPTALGGAAVGFEELSRRSGDFALVSALALVQRDGDGRVAQARLAIGGANPVPLRIAAAEQLLTGATQDDALVAQAADAAAEAVQPLDDVHGPAEYRRDLTRVVARRALARALAGGEQEAA